MHTVHGSLGTGVTDGSKLPCVLGIERRSSASSWRLWLLYRHCSFLFPFNSGKPLSSHQCLHLESAVQRTRGEAFLPEWKTFTHIKGLCKVSKAGVRRHCILHLRRTALRFLIWGEKLQNHSISKVTDTVSLKAWKQNPVNICKSVRYLRQFGCLESRSKDTV